MATNATKTTASKPSFASIAAMAPPMTNGRPQMKKENNQTKSGVSPNRQNKAAAAESPSAQQLHRELHSSMSRLAVKEPPLAASPSSDQQNNNISRAGLRLDDDQTHFSTSSTKPASLDGKSTTSGTTFALDEKESLRPDDSASVKAAEDDEFGSGPASGAQNSRVGSEAGSRAFRDQFYEITENIGSAPNRLQIQGRRLIAGIEEEAPQVTHSPHTSALPAPINLPPPPQLAATSGPSIDYKYQEPDEKLLEALDSPKDRLFLLRLEQEVIAFIRDSTEPPMIDLPPCNSFCRLLAHKLADYYALTHFVDNAVSSVRLYRTPYCRLRAPLSALATTPTTIDATTSSQPAMKIMRRAEFNKDGQIIDSGLNTTDGSIAPSKAGSEIGNDSQQSTGVTSPNDPTLAKEKSAMTREEREAIYKETRERIFGPESENADSTEAVNEVSRTSSRNEKKKKKHKNNDDGFTARSQYNVYYPSMSFSTATYEQNGNSSAYYSPYTVQPNSTMPQNAFVSAQMLQQGYQQGYQSMGNPQAFPNTMTGNSMMSSYDLPSTDGYNLHFPRPYYPQMQNGMGIGIGIGQQSPAMSSPALSNNGQFPGSQLQISDQQWAQNNYAYPYQQPRDQQQNFPHQMHNQSPISGMQSVPYQYGQLPVQPGVHGVKAQHPLPGSYKSQSFNPQTSAFVPNGGSIPPQMMHQGNSPHQPMSLSPAMSFQNGNQHGGYNQQAPLYAQMAPIPAPSTYNFGHEMKNHGARKSSAQSNATQSPAQSSLSKWGTPAHLPPKPPPPEAPSVPEGQHSLPLNNQFNANVQPLHGGQPMPSYQNGVYSMPGANPQPT